LTCSAVETASSSQERIIPSENKKQPKKRKMKRKKGPTAAEPLGNDQQQQQQQKKTNRNGQNHCAGPDSITTVVVGRDAMTSGWWACTMNVSRLPTSADYILWHGHQAPPHTHT
jgi:hypothetical protein